LPRLEAGHADRVRQREGRSEVDPGDEGERRRRDLSRADADDKVVKEAINKLYRNFTEVRDRIGDVRKNLDDAKAEVTPGYETLINTYPDIKPLVASFKKRIDKANAKN